jgi:hypothetical protein
MNTQTQTFATPEQICKYIERNHTSFVVTTDLIESNYYLLETPDSENLMVILIHKINQFYYVFTRVLKKTHLSTQFVAYAEQSKVTLNKTVFLDNILVYPARHIGSDIDIRNEPIAIEEIQIVRTLSLPIQQPFPVRMQVHEASREGHIIDYNYIQVHQPSAGARSTPVQTEEIQDDQDYRTNITCPICLGNKVNVVCIPCGHCICSTCQEQNPKKNECVICRKPIKSTNVFFI